LTTKDPKKSGRGAKQWEFFDKMDDICGAKASSLSRRQVNKRSRSQRDPRVVSTHIKDMSASKLSVGVSHTVDTAAFAAHDGTLNNTSSETDEDDVVIKDIGLKHKNNSQRSVDRKKQLKDTAPTWFTEVYRCMQDDQQEWRQQLQNRVDRQEQLQSERIAVMKQTNELLKSLVEARKKED
jgi:hypothetical protein